MRTHVKERQHSRRDIWGPDYRFTRSNEGVSTTVHVGFSKVGDLVGVPIILIRIYLGFFGPPIFWKLPYEPQSALRGSRAILRVDRSFFSW